MFKEALTFTPEGAIFDLGQKRKEKKEEGGEAWRPLWRFCAIVLSRNPPGYKSSDKPPRLPLSLLLFASYSGGGVLGERRGRGG